MPQPRTCEPDLKTAFVRTLEQIRANTSNGRVHEATYQLEVLSAAFWPESDKDGSAAADRWNDYKLTPQECRIVGALFRRLGSTLSREQLFNDMFFDRSEDVPQYKMLDVKMSHIRKKLISSPYRIETVWSIGYRMVLKPT